MVLDKEIIFYTDGKLEGTYLSRVVRDQILKAGLPITSVSIKPIDFGENIFIRGARSHSTLYSQILTGLQHSTARFVFFCEHDVLYHPSHFKFTPTREDIYYYNDNMWRFRLADKKVVGYDHACLSQICASRELLIKHYTKRLRLIANGTKAYGYEPGSGQSCSIDNPGIEFFHNQFPNIDIRHGKNWTGVKRMNPSEFRSKKTCPNWRETTIKNIKGWNYQLLSQLAMSNF